MPISCCSGGWGPPAARTPTGFSTSFPTVENPLSQGGIWKCGLAVGLNWTNPKATSNGCVASTTPTPNRYDDAIAMLDSSAFAANANQFVETIVYKAAGYSGGGGSHEVEHFGHMSVSANNAQGYEGSIGINPSGTYAFIVRWNGPEGDYTALIDPSNGVGSYTNAPTALADGDVIRSEYTVAAGVATIKLFQNGSLIVTTTDSTFLSGQPGLGFWPVDGATPENMGWKFYQAGNL